MVVIAFAVATISIALLHILDSLKLRERLGMMIMIIAWLQYKVHLRTTCLKLRTTSHFEVKSNYKQNI